MRLRSQYLYKSASGVDFIIHLVRPTYSNYGEDFGNLNPKERKTVIEPLKKIAPRVMSINISIFL